MSNPNPKNQFQKGNKPKGHRPKEDPQVKAIKLMNQNALAIIINELIDLDVADLQEILKMNPTVKVAMVAAQIINAINDKSSKSFDCIMNRLVGKVPDRIAGEDGGPISLTALIKFANSEDE